MAKFAIGDIVRYKHPSGAIIEDLHGSTGVIISVCPADFGGMQRYLVCWLSGPALTETRFGPQAPFGEAVLQLEEVSYDPTQMGDTDDDI